MRIHIIIIAFIKNKHFTKKVHIILQSVKYTDGNVYSLS